jgi:hypothetical protein
MRLNQRAVIEQIDQVVAQCNLRSPKGFDDFSDLPKEKISEAVSLLFAAIQRLSPPGSSYAKNASLHEKYIVGNSGLALSPLIGILRALRSDYENGNLQSVQELIHADIFADFLDMAEYLLNQGFKDPSAVIIGSVLEEHLRKLCLKSKIPIIQPSGSPKKADTLNADLANADIYSKLDLKSVTAWLDLRNKSAHGHYNDYTKDQVSLMLRGVQDFLVRNSG